MFIEDMYEEQGKIHLIFRESYVKIGVIISMAEYRSFKTMQKNMEEKYMIGVE